MCFKRGYQYHNNAYKFHNTLNKNTLKPLLLKAKMISYQIWKNILNNTMKKLEDDGVLYDQIVGHDSFNKPIRCTYFLIVLFSEGSGIHYIDGDAYPIGKNQLHFLFPGQEHTWETGAETIAQKITVGKAIFEEFTSIDEFQFIKHNLPPVFKIDDKMLDAVNYEMKGVQHAIQLIHTDRELRSILIKRMDSLSTLMKYEAGRYIDQRITAKLNPLLKSFWKLINLHYKQQKTTTWYADQLNISANYLNILCQKGLNVNASEMIQQRVMQEAKKNLRFSDHSVKEISYNLGFKTLSSFSAFFKKRSGYSPISYRE